MVIPRCFVMHLVLRIGRYKLLSLLTFYLTGVRLYYFRSTFVYIFKVSFKMPQGKTKVKAKKPELKTKKNKGVAFTRRHSEYFRRNWITYEESSGRYR